jgi:hypothetical protein
VEGEHADFGEDRLGPGLNPNVRGGVKLPHSGGCVLHFAGGVTIPRH